MAEHLSYKGMDFAIEYEADDRAQVTIGDRRFGMMRHGGPLRMWACDEAYFMSDDLVSVIRHLVDYWYIITSPDTASFEGPRLGELPTPAGGVVSAHPAVGAHAAASGGQPEEGGGKKRGGGQARRD